MIQAVCVSRLALLSEGSGRDLSRFLGGGSLESGYLADEISIAETGY
jgi:hypothetical protein